MSEMQQHDAHIKRYKQWLEFWELWSAIIHTG